MKRDEDEVSLGVESSGKYHGLKGRGFPRPVSTVCVLVALPILLSVASWLCWQGRGSTWIQHFNATNVIEYGSTERAEQNKDWSYCIEDPPKPAVYVEVDKRIEPLWLPAYPTSLPAVPFADLITTLTGVKNGAKSYYRTSPSLKRCHGTKRNSNVEAVTCEIVHRKLSVVVAESV